MAEAGSANGSPGRAARVGLILGPALLLAVVLIPPPQGLTEQGWRTAGVALIMAVWWMTEAIPIPATALLPLALFPVLGILDMPAAAAPFANHIIFLFMGGFLLGAAMQRWGLHERLALGIVASVGTGPRRLVLGFMLATAFLSMWISNTATTIMMLPVALAVAAMVRPGGVAGEGRGPDDDGLSDTPEGPYPFGVALMLGIAYAASIGGVATLIGTPPNAIMAAAVEELLGETVGFVQWMAVGLPVTAVMLPVTWLLLVYVLHPPGKLGGDAGAVIREKRRRLGPPSRGEGIVAVVFALTALAWVFRAPKALGDLTLPGIQSYLPWVEDSTIAMAAALLLFVIPVSWRRGEFALDWETARKIPWGVLILFGGGLSLARAMDESGLAAWIGGMVAGLGGVPLPVILAAVAALFVLLTELTSNAATTTMAMPIMAGAAVGLGQPALTLMATAAMAASMAFMLPVATPPNAIVFGSGYLTIPQMAKAGVWLNLVSVVIVTLAATFLVGVLLV